MRYTHTKMDSPPHCRMTTLTSAQSKVIAMAGIRILKSSSGSVLYVIRRLRYYHWNQLDRNELVLNLGPQGDVGHT